MPQVQFVNKARKSRKQYGIKKGDSYWWWATRSTVGGKYVKTKHYSKVQPRPSQLTSSPFMQSVLEIQESIERNGPETVDSLEEVVDSWCYDIENVKSEQEEALESIPANFQESETAETIRERIDSLEQWVGELRTIADGSNDEETLENVHQQLMDAFPGF